MVVVVIVAVVRRLGSVHRILCVTLVLTEQRELACCGG